MSSWPHLGVCPEPRSPSPAGHAFPCASFSATSPLKRQRQVQSGRACRGGRLYPPCSWLRAPPPARCTELQVTGAHRESSLISLKVEPATILHLRASPYPVVLHPALPPPHWQRRSHQILDRQPWPAEALKAILDHTITVFAQAPWSSPPVHVSGLVLVYRFWQSEGPPEWLGRCLCGLMLEQMSSGSWDWKPVTFRKRWQVKNSHINHQSVIFLSFCVHD